MRRHPLLLALATVAALLVAIPAAGALLVALPSSAQPHAAATTPAPLVPPVIHDTFSLLPCHPIDQSMVGMLGCTERDILRYDHATNQASVKVFHLLFDDAARARFVAGEAAWVKARQLVCTSRADAFEGGSGEGLAAAECERTMSAQHLLDVVGFEQVLSPG